MRESNFSNPSLNRACLSITSSLYDRRAIDSTSTLPLINSLTHLAYLTSTSPRIREMVTIDGGLERLVQILQRVPLPPSPTRPATTQLIRSIWKWSLAFQCAVNIGVRGTEHVRIRVVDAGMVPITVNVLESYLLALEQYQAPERTAKQAEKQAEKAAAAISAAAAAAAASHASVDSPTTLQVDPTTTSSSSSSSTSYVSPRRNAIHASSSLVPTIAERSQPRSRSIRHRPSSASSFSSGTSAAADAPLPPPPTLNRAEARMGRTPSGQSRISAQSTATTLQQPIHTGVTAATTEAIVSSPPTSARPLPSIIYREEEVLLSLQLLAYVSKYPHVRELFHSAEVVDGRMPDWYSIVASAAMASANGVHAHQSSSSFDSSNWSEEDEDKATATAELLKLYASRTESWSPSATEHKTVFSIAERFTLKASSSRSAITKDSRLSTEIQYWAGVIMRNACRKDESRGGVRQCANMLCGKWETYPREFAKCRRCRKAKYCTKQCQSKGWAMGHRHWCNSAKEEAEQDEAMLGRSAEKESQAQAQSQSQSQSQSPTTVRAGEAAVVLGGNGVGGSTTSSPVVPPTIPVMPMPMQMQGQGADVGDGWVSSGESVVNSPSIGHSHSALLPPPTAAMVDDAISVTVSTAPSTATTAVSPMELDLYGHGHGHGTAPMEVDSYWPSYFQ